MNDPFETLLRPQIEQSRERPVHGLITARVRSIEADGTYRLDYLPMGDDAPSARARVMMPMAGDGRGMHFFPERGDEVVVAFELGNTNLPIILGAVWNRESPPPNQAQTSPENNIRTIVSRSGHEITLDDTPGQEKVVVKSKSGHEITLDDAPGRGKVAARTAFGREMVLDDTPPGSATLRSLLATIRLDDATGSAQILSAGSLQITGTTISLVGTNVAIGGILTINGIPYQTHMHVKTGPPNLTGPVSP